LLVTRLDLARYPAVVITDAELVAGLRRQERAAFDALYARFHPRIWSFLVRLTGRRSVAEDLFQDTWLAAAQHAGRLAEDTDLAAWLFTVARNRFRSWRRWAVLDGSRLETMAQEPIEPAAAPDQEASARRTAAALSDALLLLSAADREILLLAAVEGLEAPQVAAILGLRPDAVRQRLSRARTHLAERLEKGNAASRPARKGVQ
jgi:RNA polymerase sigma-70 factor (ECF subfamily)